MAHLESFAALIFGPIGMQELVIILVIALVIFGGKKIPELGKGLGDGIRQFKSSLKGEEQAETAAQDKEPSKAS